MGPLQTYFYLALIGGIGAVVWLAMALLGLRYVLKGIAAGEQRLTFVLVGSALFVVLTFVVLAVIAACLAVAFFLSQGGKLPR